jgi:hypothetical protein
MLPSFRPLLVAAALLVAGPAVAETVTLTFVQTNDIDRAEADEGRGGFARLAGAIAAERAAGGNRSSSPTPATRSRRRCSPASTRAPTSSPSPTC